MSQGYLRYPTISHDSIVFVAEDDLWLVKSSGGRAERLTAGVAEIKTPRFSPDGKQLAFVGQFEGPEEVCLFPQVGAEAQRLTFLSSTCAVVGWVPTGEALVFASNAGQFAFKAQALYALTPQGGLPTRLPYGLANAISYGPAGAVVIGRNIGEPAHWKRYRGGRVGQLWCDLHADGQFQRLTQLAGNVACPCWIGERIYFLSDYEGCGNLYSCLPNGEDLQRHTDHHDFYARGLSSDGEHCVYHAGGDLYVFDPGANQTRRITVELPSNRPQRSRKFVAASAFLESYALHPQGQAVALTARGKAFSLAHWDGPVLQYGQTDGVRYRSLSWLNDGERLVAIHDRAGQEELVLLPPDASHKEPRTVPALDLGRVLSLDVAPTKDTVALTNHRQELMIVDVETGEQRLLDRSPYAPIGEIAWSPDSRWLAYTFACSLQKRAIKLCNVETGETFFATDPVLQDRAPAFDPDGKYLYFIGKRTFNPVYDNLQYLELSFPFGEKPYAITLQRDLHSPFLAEPPATKTREEEQEEKDQESGAEADGANSGAKPIMIDLEGMDTRLVPFPLPEGRYKQVQGIKGKVLVLSLPLESAFQEDAEEDGAGKLGSFDLETRTHEIIAEGVQSFTVSRDGKQVMYRSKRRLRAFKAGEKPGKQEHGDRPTRANGWLDLDRVKVSVQPVAEWTQMFAEAWRLQRDHFWQAQMPGGDWQAIYERYAPLAERLGSRAELSDLIWEMQGELGTSHANERGGEYRKGPSYGQGFLGVDWQYDENGDQPHYRIARVLQGDPGNSKETSPLNSPGLQVQAGDAIVAINGQPLAPGQHPMELLVNTAGSDVQLTMEAHNSGATRVLTVKTLKSERDARYREWVQANRKLVHERSEGRIGYIHVPDMHAHGFAEFQRGYQIEHDALGLIIDVRWNSGGHVSSLLLEKLACRRIGYRFWRWKQPRSYPFDSPRGPMVALANAYTASDGDKFAHSFKLMGLGPLLGTRTWGGVIGISSYRYLVDGTAISQPECANWFPDVSWHLENHGTEPDILVEHTPHDEASGADAQLQRAIEACLTLIEHSPSEEPTL